MKKRSPYMARLVIALAFVVGASNAARGEEFYKGKMIRFIVGFSAGGGFDTYTRAIARHIGKHIPGNPSTVVQNMPGAGSLIAANYVYNKARPDGLTIGTWVGGLVLQQVMGGKAIKFDARRFEWVGTLVRESHACALTKASGITSLDKWFAATTPVKIGATAPGSTTDDIPRMLRAFLNLPIQLIEGYKGTSKIRLAAEGGEIAGGCWTWSSIKVTWRKALESGEVRVVLQINPKKHPDLPDVPNAVDYVKTDEARRLIQAGIHKQGAILRVYSLPPGTPKDRVQLVRRAFMDTMTDPEFLAETKKARLAIDPLPGEAVAKHVSGFFELKPQLVAKLKEILVPK
ncbi:MAG: Bug family tripartite tricarboxylate transporter substrate binding protein [Candidatus Binatia bacterium]